MLFIKILREKSFKISAFSMMKYKFWLYIYYCQGWGKTQGTGGKYKNAHPILQQAALKINSNTACHSKNHKGQNTYQSIFQKKKKI